MNKKRTRKVKKLFVPFSELDFMPGRGGVDYLNEILWTLIEQINALEKKLKANQK